MAGISKIITSIETAETPVRNSQAESVVHENPTIRPTQPLEQYQFNEEPQNFRWVTIFTVFAIVIWLLATGLLLFSVLKITADWPNYSSLQWLGIVLLVTVPLCLVGLTSYALRQLAKLSTQSDRLEIVAERLTQPDQLIVQKSEIMAGAIATQIDHINAKLNEGLGRISALDEVLSTQTSSIDTTNVKAVEAVESIGQSLEHQKQALSVISTTFDNSMDALSSTIATHTQELADAARMAEQKIKEARISVEGATSKINSASDIVRTNTVQAATTLSSSHEEIKTLGDIIKQRSEELDGVYKKHAQDLSVMIEHLRDEQQNLGANMEDTLIKMRDLSLSAQTSAESLAEASSSGKETIQALAQSASLADNAVKTRFAEMEQMVRYSTDHAQNIGAMASRRVQDSLEHTRKEISRIEEDMTKLQDKLAESTRNATIDLVQQNTPTENLIRSKDRPRLQLQPIEADPNSESADTEQLKINPPTSSSTREEGAQKSREARVEIEETLDLEIEAPDLNDLQQPLLEVGAIIDAIRPVAEYEPGNKPKTSFSLRGLFSGPSKNEEDASLSIAETTEDEQPVKAEDSVLSNAMITMLSAAGLSPNVVVDDGCVIEAANNRSAQGHEAMSRGVISRLNGPVRHFARSLSSDSELSRHAIAFATEFDQRVEQHSGDREAIRSKLESEYGRAYLLCDAALNFGRV